MKTLKILPKTKLPKVRAEYGSIVATLKVLKVGESFIYPTRNHPYKIARKIGIRVTGRAVPNGFGFRFWRVS